MYLYSSVLSVILKFIKVSVTYASPMKLTLSLDSNGIELLPSRKRRKVFLFFSSVQVLLEQGRCACTQMLI